MNRLAADNLSPALLGDLDTILRKAPNLIEAMRDTAKGTGNLRMLHRVLQFQQHLYQALYFTSSPLLQLPHFGVTEAKHASSGKGNYRTLLQFIEAKALDDKGRKKGMANMTDEHCADVEVLCKYLPLVDFDVQAGCLDYEDDDKKVHFDEVCAAGDILTFYIEIKRQNDKIPDSELGIAHAPFYPLFVEEEWFITLGKAGNEENLFSVVEVKEHENVIRHKMQLPTRGLKPGTYDFDLYLTSTCYVGLDKKTTVKVDLVDPKTVKPAEVHPEDIEAENAPSLFDLLQEGGEEDEDSDFGSDDEDGNTKKKIALKKDADEKDKKVEEQDKSDEQVADEEVDSDDDLVAVELVDGVPETKKNK
eukprot:CAMPEP_0204864664 /NCGR_PEP_ID=MMETSP1348-20121228/4210_1 /ASSEMBLY_ACC=CAM_ASM_000700 /TAXON_ID=215587 /ORGANISM="Aplanochytrium stocchinoi, Strain GSBS06" /LENGTH=361 /DNA_ID=CAMNT_0052015347 /DNA_START=78 /DNA_END=1163 /DNA_ORIENTATION=+